MSNSIADLLRFFHVQRIKGFATPDEPMLDGETLARLKQEMSSVSLYLEFGSGGSTILADRIGVQGISVEGDRYYAAAVRRGLKTGGMTILTPDIGVTGPWGWPLLKRRTPRRLARWRRYIEAPFARMEGFPDLILVDGRFRVACTLEAARQARARGHSATLILDDYSYRPEYHRVEQYLGVPEISGRAAIFRIGSQVVPDTAVEIALRDPF